MEYLFSLLPLGGYIKLLDSRESPIAQAEKSSAFDTQPVWVRTAILLAGPAMNVLLGLLVFILIFTLGAPRITPTVGEVLPFSIAAQAKLPVGAEIKAVDGQPVDSWQPIIMQVISRLGESSTLTFTALAPASSTPQTFSLPLANWSMDKLEPEPLKSLGIVPYHPAIPAIIAALALDSPAKAAGLRVGDQIVALDGQVITTWPDLVQSIQTLPGKTVSLGLLRSGKYLSIHLTLGRRLSGTHWLGHMGIKVQPPVWPAKQRRLVQLSPLAATKQAAHEVLAIAQFHGVILKKMLQGKISLLSLGGPITLFQDSALAAQQGVVVYLRFLGLLSVTLACINLLPIPGLDGGQLLFCLVEGIIRRPIALHWQMLLLRLGMTALIVLMIQAMANDLIRLI